MNGQFDFGDVSPLKYFLSLSFGLGLLFAFISGSDESPRTWLTFLQWQLQTVIPVLILIQAHRLIVQKTSLSRASMVIQFAVSGVMGATLFTPLALGIDYWVEGGLEEPTFLLALVDEWGGVTFPVTLAWMLMNIPLIGGLTFRRQQTADAQPDLAEPKPVATQPAFLSMCHCQNLADIEALQAELHYISVVFTDKPELILYSLKDAVEELPDNLGWRTHRSCWVAFAHVTQIVQQGRQGEAITKTGNRYPISRSQFAEFKSAWEQFAQL